MRQRSYSNGRLVLIEAGIMILVFAIASTTILSIFIRTEYMRNQTRQLNEAVIYGQNVIEALKNNKEIDSFSSNVLICEVEKKVEQTVTGYMMYYDVKIKNRHTDEVVYQIETGTYQYEN
ncbi:MAG: type IV pilus modification PilV family protein [Cellulosilyticaceae bacterium]